MRAQTQFKKKVLSASIKSWKNERIMLYRLYLLTDFSDEKKSSMMATNRSEMTVENYALISGLISNHEYSCVTSGCFCKNGDHEKDKQRRHVDEHHSESKA